MNSQTSAKSHASLAWVKPELDHLFQQIRQEVDNFVENPNSMGPIRRSVECLYQVRGALRILELDALAMVSEELESLANGLVSGKLTNRNDVCAMLMRGTVLLPDYLERLQNGYRDVPIVLLPVLNEIRSLKGESPLDESVMMALDTSAEPATLEEIEHAKGSLSGHNRELLDTVGGVIKEELLRIKDSLDLHLRTGKDVNELQPQLEEFGRVADTLALMGLTDPQVLLLEQKRALQSLIDRHQQLDEKTMLNLAGTLLHVDAALDNLVDNLGGQLLPGNSPVLSAEARQTLDILVNEAKTNLQRARDCFVGFVETDWNHEQLVAVPPLLAEVTGAMQILDFKSAADYLQGIALYTQRELIDKHQVPEEQQLNALADAIASLEYYLESLKDRRSNYTEILDITRTSLIALGYWPLPELAEAGSSAPAQIADYAYHDGAIGSFVEESNRTVSQPISTESSKSDELLPVHQSSAIIGGFDQQANDEVGDDIREVFLEEFEEELGNLGSLLLKWKSNLQSHEAIRPIRRVFHTLKGSGRLVGAQMLGEFSWKVENMLNRILDDSCQPSTAVFDMVQHAADVLPEFLQALKGERSVQTNIAEIEKAVEACAAGEQFSYTPSSRSTAAEPLPGQAPALPVAADKAVLPSRSAKDEQPAQAESSQPGIPFSLDPVLCDILAAELRTHLETIHAWLNVNARGDRLVTEKLLRAVHTMNGAFAMTDVPEISQVTQFTEAYVKRSIAAHAPLTETGIQTLRTAADAVAHTASILHDSQPRVPSYSALIEQLTQLVNTLPDGQWPPREQLDREREAEHTEWERENSQPIAGSGKGPASFVEQPETPAGQRWGTEPARTDEVPSAPASPMTVQGRGTEPARTDEVPSTPASPSSEPGGRSPANRQLPDLGPLDGEELDLDLVDIFVEEGQDILDQCDNCIYNLRQKISDSEPVFSLQRSLHTLKGGARMAGINAIGDLGHTIESLLEAVMANRTRLESIDLRLLESAFDRLQLMLQRTSSHRKVAMPSAMIALFARRIAGQSLDLSAIQEAERVEEAGSLSAAISVADQAPQQVKKDVVTPEPVSTAYPELSPTPPVPSVASPPAEFAEAVGTQEQDAFEDDAPLARPAQDQVRVRADLLDSLVSSAGEVAIYRSRLEQQLGSFRSAMIELDRTNTRLRDQLRRLDLETEAQIVARYQREGEQPAREFDPLELDRFSTLQQLSRALNESAADLSGLQSLLDDLSRQYDNLLQQQSRVSSDLQDGLMRARMIPFDTVVPRLRRVVRQAASETGKLAQLRLVGTHSELDRKVLDRMIAPLEHMLRNSVAHGLEVPAQRRQRKKREEGTISIQIRHEGSEIVLEVTDDGAGLNRQAILSRAQQRQIVAPNAELTDFEIDNLIFSSGLSTSASVSQLAGRGVGMDVVRSEVRQLGGTVEIQSTPGRGVCFTLRLPQTLAVTQAVFVRIGESIFAVPVGSVNGIGRIARERYSSEQVTVYRYANEEYALHDLGILVGQAPSAVEGQAEVPLLLVRSGEIRAAVAIDEVLGSREIVVKSVGMQITSIPGIYGGTITGDGRVVVILDVAPLVRRHLTQPVDQRRRVSVPEQKETPVVMVVDDSLTMRKVSSRVLERNNFAVMTARDGIEALELMEDKVPDLMLLDIEMPRMDGYELATAMRKDPNLQAVPIIMITSRSGDKHRQRALKIGVQRYLGKPYQELDLMRNVYDVLGIARAQE